MNKILIPKEGNSTFTMIYAKVGSRGEPDTIKGISHFLEHMMFKGTLTKNSRQIAYAIERYGADLNAFTDHEITAYWIKSANKYKEEAKEILLDMLTNSTFPQIELDKEREVIVQELKMYEDSPRAAVNEIFQKALFEPSSGLYLPIIGTLESLKNINREELCKYFKEYYNNLTLVQIGDVEKEIIEIKNLNKFPLAPITKNLKGRNDTIVTRKAISQANIVIGNVIPPSNRNRLDTFVLTDLLEGIMNDMSGRLFSTIREKHNLCYRIRFGAGIYSCGLLAWWISIGLEASKIDSAYKLIMEELTKEITDEEINYAVTKKIGEMALKYDNTQIIGQTIAYLDLKGIDYKEYIFNYEKHAKEQAKYLKEFVKGISFTDNAVAQLIPE